MKSLSTDVAIIGAGTAGIAAERKAREAGAETLLIDPQFAGTTCATVGCMPSKLLIAAANAAHDARKSATFGIRLPEIDVDTSAVMRRLRFERDRFVKAARSNFSSLPHGVCLQASARFATPNKLILDNGNSVTALAVVIATGASPNIPAPFERLGDLLLTNETVFELTSLPVSLAMIGAGPLGIEMAQALSRLGVRVAVFDRGDRVAGIADEDVRKAISTALREEMDIYLDADIAAERTGKAVAVRGGGSDLGEFERLFVAAGRRPNLQGMDIEKAGIEIGKNGVPVFDRQTLQCGDAPIFIAGDANSDRPVLHEAAAEGAIAGGNAAGYPDVKPSRRKIAMSIVFSDPNVAVIGEQPEDRDRRTVSGTARYGNQGRARVEARAAGVAKLHADASDGRLVGAVMAGPDVEHLAHTLSWMIQNGAAAQDLLELPFYHPTGEEGLKDALREICASVSAPRSRDRDDGFLPGT